MLIGKKEGWVIIFIFALSPHLNDKLSSISLLLQKFLEVF